MINESLQSAVTPTNEDFSSLGLTWDEANFTWNSASGTWENPYVITNESVTSATMTNENLS